jgi:hypothetical protein
MAQKQAHKQTDTHTYTSHAHTHTHKHTHTRTHTHETMHTHKHTHYHTCTHAPSRGAVVLTNVAHASRSLTDKLQRARAAMLSRKKRQKANSRGGTPCKSASQPGTWLPCACAALPWLLCGCACGCAVLTAPAGEGLAVVCVAAGLMVPMRAARMASSSRSSSRAGTHTVVKRLDSAGESSLCV